MALLSPQVERFLSTKLYCSFNSFKNSPRNNVNFKANGLRPCSSIAIDSASSSSSSVGDVAGVRWGVASLQGLRDEMEDVAVVRSDGFDGFSFAAVFDGHAGLSSVKFLRDELYKECVAALEGGLLLREKDPGAIREALKEAFENTDSKLLNWLEMTAEEDESGSTATVMLIGDDSVFISHVGDSSVVLSRSGKDEVLTKSHRPYGSNQVSLQEIRRIREAGGWIINGRICGDIAVSRAFGDQRFKTKKNEMLKKGVEEGRWTEKFVSRVKFNGNLLTATPDVLQASLGPDVEFIILATDGLWDYMKCSDVVNFVRNQLRQHGNVQQACETLAQLALDRRSEDNVTIVIADLGQTDWRNLSQEQQNLLYELGQALATVGILILGIWMSSSLSL